MFGAVEPVWRMVIRHVSVLAAVYAATRGRFDIAGGLAAFWLMLTAWASHTTSERLQDGWLSTLFVGRRSKKPVPARARLVMDRRPSLS
jgi:hypothetical protein